MSAVESDIATSLVVHVPTAATFGLGGDPLADRPADLAGKVVGLLWNGKAMGDVALRTVGRALEERHPDVEVRFYPGLLPCPPELLEQVADECDVVVGCTADCGSCTSWMAHDCVEVERRGTPAVVLASAGFELNLQASAKAFGMPALRFVTVPAVYNNLDTQAAIDQTLPAVDDLVAELTGDLAQPVDVVDEPTRLDYGTGETPAAFREFNRDFLDRDWGDGYPLWPPTADVVDELVAGAGLDRDDVVCVLPPGNGHATVEAVAVNAALAGCLPAEIPVVIAALRAVAQMPAPANRIVLMSTSAHAPLFLVNGPVAERLGINGGRCCLGPGQQNAVNIRIARAILLCLKNIGRWYPGVMDLDTVGTARKFGMLIAENEAESPWDPYHVGRGYRPEQDVVSAFFTAGDWDVGFQGHVDVPQLARAIASQVGIGVDNGYMTSFIGSPSTKASGPRGAGRLVVLAPQFARPLADGGFDQRGLAEFFHDHIKVPLLQNIETARKLHADGKIRPEWEHVFELAADEAATRMVPLLRDPELFDIVVAGDVRAKGLVFPIWNRPVSVPVE